MKRDTLIFAYTNEIHELTNSMYEHLMDDEIDEAFNDIESVRSILKEIKSSFTEEL